MGQPKAPTVEYKTPKPAIINEQVKPSTLAGQGAFLENTYFNLNSALAARNAAADSLLGRATTPTVDEKGEVIPTNRAFVPFDVGNFIDPAKNTYLAAEIAENKEMDRKRRREERIAARREQMDDEMNNIFGMPRASYLAAMNRVANQGRST